MPATPTDDTEHRPTQARSSVATGASPRPPATVRPRSARPGGIDPWRHVFPAMVAVLALMIPLLGWIGFNVVLNSSDGNIAESESDPTAPGYEALVDPTPTLFVLETHEDEAVGAAALVLEGEGAGSVIVIPPSTVAPLDGVNTTIADAYATGGLESAQAVAASALGAAFGEAVVVDDAQMADLVEPLGSLTVTVPDPVVDPTTGEELFAAGEVEVSPQQLGVFLGTRTTDAAEVNRMLRYQEFWTAWLEAVGAGGADAVPGEGDSGLGYFVRQMALGDWQVLSLPTDALPIPGSDAVLSNPRPEEVAAMVAEVIPFPVGAPEGARLRVRVLDGTGELSQGLVAVQPLVLGGGEVAGIGNAAEFGAETTRIVYADPANEQRVAALVEALGVGEAVLDEGAGSAFDVTVVLGRDAVGVLAGDGSTITGASDAPASGS